MSCLCGEPIPDPPDDRRDLIAMGHWVADCLDAKNQMTWRTIVRRLVDELERLSEDDDECAHPTVDVATVGEREPRHIPACPCDQEPYQ